MSHTLKQLLAALATVAVLGAAAGCGADEQPQANEPSSPSSQTSDSTKPSPSEKSSQVGSQESAKATITIEDFAYSDPGPVAPGTEITVENADDTAHTVTAEDEGGFDVTVAPGESATFTAPSETGDYPFVCSFHANMSGTLAVE